MVLNGATTGKKTGRRSSISEREWELSLLAYWRDERTAREIAEDFGIHHSNVVRKFQRMQEREPQILDRLHAEEIRAGALTTADPIAPGSDKHGDDGDSDECATPDSTPTGVAA
jgi:hypothetical protein